jgi:UDP-N-acetylglucosamine--N-acetylmuramyl-(pentapeptide) pyrophosphoryl-undecaprenol N-acetylglucosamine transferase
MIKVIISGGGTGGHVYPAIAIANALSKRVKGIEILFIGAKGKMEMQKVPAAGYRIEGLQISGFHRRLTWKNLTFPFKLIFSLWKTSNILNRFKPDVVVGVGGYASGPALKSAVSNKIPTLIQEQNSYPGITNKILGSKVNTICVAYDGMERFFPKEKIVLTGNPVRQDLIHISEKRDESFRFFNLKNNMTTILVLGGSLGARTINRSVTHCIINQNITSKGIQIIWQTGKFYFDAIASDPVLSDNPDLHIYAFIDRMDLAFGCADIVVSRAGAISISELCIAGKPAILIPSPNVAEDHQTRNAESLVNHQAAILLKDNEAELRLFDTISALVSDSAQQKKYSENIKKLAIPDAADHIADEVLKLIKKTGNT